MPEPKQISDAELLHSISNGDEEALAVLYDRYQTILFSIIARLLNSREEAEDILQEVFLQVWNKSGNYEEARGRVFTWLVTLSRSRAIDRLRSMGVREKAIDEASHEAFDAVSHAETDTIHNEKKKRVKSILAQLPEEQRIVLFMAYFEGHSQTEIAQTLNLPLGTVKTRMRSGTIRLRDNFGDSLKDLI